jgi:hypothetical protein
MWRRPSRRSRHSCITCLSYRTRSNRCHHSITSSSSTLLSFAFVAVVASGVWVLDAMNHSERCNRQLRALILLHRPVCSSDEACCLDAAGVNLSHYEPHIHAKDPSQGNTAALVVRHVNNERSDVFRVLDSHRVRGRGLLVHDNLLGRVCAWSRLLGCICMGSGTGKRQIADTGQVDRQT